MAKSAWIFPASPERFDLREALKHLRIFRWRVRQFKDEIRAGDDVFLWLAGKQGGMVARGTILTDPQIMGDAPEELRFERKAEQPGDKPCTAIEVDTVFKQPVERTTLKEHAVLSSISLLIQTRGTNFRLADNQASSLNIFCPRATACGVSLAEAFARFRDSRVDQVRVGVRRKRAEQLTEFLADLDNIDLATFNSEVWRLESTTILDGKDVCGMLFDPNPPDSELTEKVAEALEAGTLEMHGNYVWRSASSVYGSRLTSVTDEEKEHHIQTALEVLNDAMLSTTDKAEKINQVPGFGFTTATGLVMVFHPNDFAIKDKQSDGALFRLQLPNDNLRIGREISVGYLLCGAPEGPVPGKRYPTLISRSLLSEFQDSVARLKTQLGASDFLELDGFLYQINQGTIEIGDQGLAAKMLRDIDDQIQANIDSSSTPSKTEKEQLVKSRIGQGLFRQNVQKFESACRASGVKDSRFLIASHIKPWRSCSNEERLDGANGLFLSPSIDLLFDRGHTSFDDNGTLLVSSAINAKTLNRLGVPFETSHCGLFLPKQQQYLEYHRRHIFLGSTD